MPLHHGPRLPKVSELGLVWDMNNQKSWKGTPTSNLISSSNFTDTSYWVTYSGDPERSFSHIGPYNIPFFEMSDNSTSSFEGYRYNNMPATGSEEYTLSIWIQVNESESGQSHFRINPSNGGLYSMRVNHADGTAQLARNDAGFTTLAIGNRYLTWNGILYSQLYASFKPAPATTSFLSVQLLIGHDPDSSATTCTGYFGAPQLTLGDTINTFEFVNGTRTDTECLLDLTNKNTIKVTNLTLDTDGEFECASGSNPQIEMVDDLPTDYSSFSVSLWVYPTTTDIPSVNDYRYIVSSNQSANFIILEASKAVSFRVPGIETAINFISGNIPNDEYSMITCVYEDTGIRKIFVNGELKGSNVTAGSGPASLGRLYFCRDVTDHTYEGKIFSGYFWNDALTDDEVKELFQLQRGRFGL